MNNRSAWVLLAVVCGAFGWGLVWLYDLRLGTGDIYPVYSSLRADPLGAKVLFESVSALPGYTAERNFHGLDELVGRPATVVWLGEDPFTFAVRPEDDLRQFENIAAGGARLVIAMTPVRPVTSARQMEIRGGALEKLWGVRFTYLKGSVAPAEPSGGLLPKRTALIIHSGGQVTPVFEKAFGRGCVVLVDNAYAFSNEALATERNTELLSRVLGANHRIVFDEHHLGLSEEASIMMLARKYRLGGLAIGLILLAALFVRRNSSPLLPPRRHPEEDMEGAKGQDSAAALHHLLKRNVAESELVRTCLTEWEKSAHDGKALSQEKLAIIRRLAAPRDKQSPLDVYRRLQSVITHRD